MIPTIEFDRAWHRTFLNELEEDQPSGNFALYNLAYEATKATMIPSFDGLQSLNYLSNVTPLPHQIETANEVVQHMNGKAILADEVGLGKTIEAGLVLKEYMVRGLVKKALIMVPASLISQWVNELNEKFYIPAVPHKKGYAIQEYDVVVTSLDTAKRTPHRELILDQSYDMIIVDEAHRLKNNKTKSYEFVQGLKKKFCLLLTATPIQNNVHEIFHLVSLLKPGHLGDLEAFNRFFKNKQQSIEEDGYLKELVNKVMIRNRRRHIGIKWTKRHIQNIVVSFTKEEKEFYDLLSTLNHKSAFSSITLQREACSSKEAVHVTLEKLYHQIEEGALQEQFHLLFEKLNTIKGNAKAEAVYNLLKDSNEKFIIFTEYRATQTYLQWYLNQKGITNVPFNGKFKKSKRDWMKQLFEHNAQVLIATEAGGEGINLQFCHNVINYDLPWNPMKLEQRIGRVHRLGQKQDVNIYNFSISGTIEERILDLLYTKIHLFECVVGELDDILSNLKNFDVEAYIEDIFLRSKSEGEVRIKMEHLKEVLHLSEDFINEQEKKYGS